MNPSLFIASSSEEIDVARQFANALSEVAEPTLWTDAPEFRPTCSTLDGLFASAEHYDFGLFIFTPDDAITSRGENSFSARDNVILEFGLFLGRLGRERAFAVVADGEDPDNKVKGIADLFGITLPRFFTKPPSKLRSSIAAAAKQLRLQIELAGRRDLMIPLLRKWNFKHHKATFSATLGGAYLQRAKDRLVGMRIAVVCREEDRSVNFHEDRRLAFSEVRTPTFTAMDMVFKVSDRNVLGELDEDDVVEGYVVLIPPSFTLKKGITLHDMCADGCIIVDGGAKSESGSARRL